MLNAIIEQIRKRYPDAKIAMELNIGKDPEFNEVQYQKIRSYGLYIKPGGRRYRIPASIYTSLFFRFSELWPYILPEKQIDVVLDASGFAFGDQWGAAFARKRLSGNIKRWKRDGKKIILLPQAFGPFENQNVLSELRKIIRHADLIFARDQISYNHLKGLPDTDETIYLRPDFTNLSVGEKPEKFDPEKLQVAIIPNFKMLTGGQNTADYLQLLKDTVVIIREQGYKPFFLMHEGKKDEEIALKVNGLLNRPIDIVWEPDPLKLKGIIGAVYGVITSRFHGLVSALSQGVPSLATSWSHKYEMLLDDYNYGEGLVKPPYDNLKGKIAVLLDEEQNARIRQKLKDKAVVEKQKSADMWERVFQCLEA